MAAKEKYHSIQLPVELFYLTDEPTADIILADSRKREVKRILVYVVLFVIRY